jgi:tetratricopeptide (TPR) repeat protein
MMTARRQRAGLLALFAVSLLALPWSAGAAQPAGRPESHRSVPVAAETLARADALFAEGRRLLEKGSVAAACARFQESNALAPRGGTALNLGLCLEQVGDLGVARVALQAALARALEDGRTDRVPIAREHLAAVESRLARAAEENLRTRLATGEELLGRGLAANACAQAQAAVADTPTAAALWRFLGRCHMRLRQVEQARTCFRKYLELAPTADDAAFVRASVGEATP